MRELSGPIGCNQHGAPTRRGLPRQEGQRPGARVKRRPKQAAGRSRHKRRQQAAGTGWGRESAATSATRTQETEHKLRPGHPDKQRTPRDHGVGRRGRHGTGTNRRKGPLQDSVLLRPRPEGRCCCSGWALGLDPGAGRGRSPAGTGPLPVRKLPTRGQPPSTGKRFAARVSLGGEGTGRKPCLPPPASPSTPHPGGAQQGAGSEPMGGGGRRVRVGRGLSHTAGGQAGGTNPPREQAPEPGGPAPRCQGGAAGQGGAWSSGSALQARAHGVRRVQVQGSQRRRCPRSDDTAQPGQVVVPRPRPAAEEPGSLGRPQAGSGKQEVEAPWSTLAAPGQGPLGPTGNQGPTVMLVRNVNPDKKRDSYLVSKRTPRTLQTTQAAGGRTVRPGRRGLESSGPGGRHAV